MIQAGLVFFILFLSISVNLPSSVIARFGFYADYLMAALVAVVITGLVYHKKLFLIVLVILCSVGTNMPEEVMRDWGLDRDILFGILVALVVTPIGVKVSGRRFS